MGDTAREALKIRCPICRSDDIAQVVRMRKFRGGAEPVKFQKSECRACGTEFTAGAQLRHNKTVLDAWLESIRTGEPVTLEDGSICFACPPKEDR